MSCEFCEKADFGSFRAEVESYGAYISLAGGSGRFPKHEQFAFCPMCGEPLAEPQPLTLDELREMDGKPVWLQLCGDVSGHWALVDVCYRVFATSNGYLSFDYIGIDAVPYRRPPKEAAS